MRWISWLAERLLASQSLCWMDWVIHSHTNSSPNTLIQMIISRWWLHYTLQCIQRHTTALRISAAKLSYCWTVWENDRAQQTRKGTQMKRSCFKDQSWHSPWGPQEGYENPQSEQSVSRPRHEPNTSETNRCSRIVPKEQSRSQKKKGGAYRLPVTHPQAELGSFIRACQAPEKNILYLFI
jgi:hypothetical protein